MLFIMGKLNAQENSQWKEMILKIPVITEHSVSIINRQLSCFEGLHFSGYVKSASCLLIKYDEKKIPDPQIISKTVHYLNYKIPVKHIKNLSFFDVIDGKGKN